MVKKRAVAGHPPRFSWAGITRDYAYVLPGFFISLCAFVVLVPLTLLSVATLIVWVGALLLPVTLRVASRFADVSRSRARKMGLPVQASEYAPRARGFTGWMRTLGEPVRWLELAFETVIALPLRLFTFTVAVVCTVGAAAGVTYPLWGFFVPREDNSLPGIILQAVTGGAVSDEFAHSYALDAGFNVVLGLVFLVTLPLVIRGLALLDLSVVRAALGTLSTPDASNATGTHGSPVAPVTPSTLGTFSPEHTRQSRAPRPSLSGDAWSTIVAIFCAIIAVAVGWPLLGVLYLAPVAIAMVIALAQAAALVLAVRAPIAAVIVQSGALFATVFTASEHTIWPWPWPVLAIILQSVLVLLISLRSPWWMAALAWAAPQAAVQLAVLLHDAGPTAYPSMVISASVTLGLAIIGTVLRQLFTSRGALRDEQRLSAEQLARRQELEERNRIAQELHDVVAHSMSVISVQANTAKYRLPELPGDAAAEFESIAQSSRQALSEMRSLLTLLRVSDEHHDPSLAPQPTLADISALVETTKRSGAPVSLSMTGVTGADDPPVSAATELTTYRVVQESLSNAMRHAPGAHIAVSIAGVGERVEVSIENGVADRGTPHPPAPGAGLGLAGVRERVTALGGTVTAAASDEGGFLVRAVLPRRPDSFHSTR